MNRGDVKLVIDRCIAHDVPDAADMIESLRQQLAECQAALVVKDEALESCGHGDEWHDPEMCEQYYDLKLVARAIAIKPSDAELRKLIAKYVRWAGKVLNWPDDESLYDAIESGEIRL